MPRPYLGDPKYTIEVLQKYNFAFQKRFGQNFLIDTHVLDKIIDSAQITKDDFVLEIGPGIGTMTQYLAEAAREVAAVEIDKTLLPILDDTLKDWDNVTVINNDILKVDIRQLALEKNQGRPIKVVANLPYYITTPIIMGLFENQVPVDSITIMVQKEVADRMQVGPGTKDYGALSLAVQYYAKPKIVANVPPNCFMPRPKVGSAVIRLERYEKPPVEVKNEKLMFRIIRASFNQRRKTLLHKLADRGVNYIDTARGYTVSEEYLGYALEGIRDRFIIATKSMARTKEAMAEDIEKSLHNLRTDHIELYQVHNPSMEQLDQVQAAGGALEALQEARTAGKIGHIGLTAHSVEVFARALELDWVETIMFPYNIVESQGEELISKCEEKNIGFIDMKPLAGGAIENGTLALRYVCSNKNVTIVIPGMAEEKEIEENIKACLDDSPLSEKELEEVQTVRNQLGTNFCRRCNYCAPCSVGIDISGVFLFAGYLNRYGLGDWARNRYSSLAVKASACIECGKCETRCPYHLPIREMLKECAQQFGE